MLEWWGCYMAPVLTQKNVQDHAPPDFQPVGDGRMMKGEE